MSNFACAVLFFMLANTAAAQSFTGSISGTVTDSTGAAIIGAKVTVTDLDRNTTLSGVTTESGFYVVSPIPPGRYRISAERTGFRRYVLEPFPITTQQKASVDITLDIGQITESVTVTGTAQLVEATNATLSGVVQNKRIIDLPLNGRNVYALAALTPGVFGWRPASGNGGVGEGFESIGRFTINGGRDSSNAILMDGVPVTMNANTQNMNANSAVPSVEGVEEFRIQTNAFSAEYGRSGGGILTIATKSGTNELHGSMFEFLRNSRMDANNFFANAGGRKLGSFKRNEFGASAGGPILIPKLYNGKNRTFFFNTYEGRRQRSAAVSQFTLPTDEQMAGDFSQTLNAAGAVRVIYDPNTTAADPSRPGQFLRTPFAGNRIPTSRFDPVAAAAQRFYTARPNTPGANFTRQQNFLFQGAVPTTVDRATAKVDHNLTDKQRMFVRYTIFNNQSSQPEYWPGPGCPDGGCFSNAERQQNAGLDYTYTMSPTTMLSLRYGFARSILNRGSWYQGFRPSTLGLPNTVEQGADLLVFPQFGIEEMTPVGLQHHWNFRSANMSHTAVGTLTKVHGNHNYKIGGEFRQHLINHMQAPWQLIFNFDRAMTQGPDPRTPSAIGGFGYASFLLGAGASGNVVNGLRPAIASKSYGLYLQDDWKVNRKLTLNLGIRWDVETGLTERYDRFGVFDPSVESPLAARSGLSNLRGGWTFPTSGLGRRTLRNPMWDRFAPRIGLAYQLHPKTVIRAGYGIFFLPATYGANYYATSPFTASTPWVSSLDGITPLNYLRNPFPDGIVRPEGANGGLAAATGLGVGSPIPSLMSVPYNQQWNFTIQQQFTPTTALEIAYAGNKGTKLPIGWNMDQVPTALVRPETGLLDQVNNPFFGLIQVGAMSTRTVQRGQLLTPFAQYPSVSYSAMPWGNSNYHALEMKFEKRFSSGNSVVVAYTWSKLLSDGGDNAWASAGPRDNYCRACEKSLSPYDQRHRLVTSFTYDLPFGRGKTLGSNWNSWMNAILGQWQANGIVTVNTGLPLQMSVAQNTSFSFGGGQRPDSNGRDARIAESEKTLNRWFDTGAFSQPAQYTFGTVGRMHPTLRADRVELIDFSLFKNFQIRERMSVQFRAESFNLANHVILGDPNTTFGNVNFGRVTGQANGPRQTQLALKFLF